MIKVKVINGNGWYHNKVGEVFDVIEGDFGLSEKKYFSIVNNNNCLINQSDCEIIYEPTDKEVLKFFYKEYCKNNRRHKTYQANRLLDIISKH